MLNSLMLRISHPYIRPLVPYVPKTREECLFPKAKEDSILKCAVAPMILPKAEED
jgi:hypothetical protein